MFSIKNLFTKESRISVGDSVTTSLRGRKVTAKVLDCYYDENLYVVEAKLLGVTIVCPRKRHQLDLVEDAEIIDVIKDVKHMEAMLDMPAYVESGYMALM